VVGGHGLVGAGGDPYGDARQQGGGAAGEVLGPLGRGVEERQLGDGREGRGEVAERLEVDQTAADHGHGVGAGPVEQRAGGGRGGGGRAGGGDLRAFEERLGAAGRHRVQDDRRAGARQPGAEVGREGRDPLDARGGTVAADVGGQADDAVGPVAGETQERRVRHRRGALVVPPVGLPDELQHGG